MGPDLRPSGPDLDAAATAERIAAIQAAMAKGDLPHNAALLRRLRRGDTNGTLVMRRIAWAELLHSGHAAPKTAFLQRLVPTGLALRTTRQRPGRRPVLQSQGLTERVAAALGVPVQPLRRALRALRADLCLWLLDPATAGLEAELRPRMVAPALRFLTEDRRQSPRWRIPALATLDQAWDHRSLPHFYRVLSQSAPPRLIGAWFAFELEVWAVVCTSQMSQGSPLTPFDRQVLEAGRARRRLPELICAVQGATGIPLDHSTVEGYRHLLQYGTLPGAPISGREAESS